MSASITVPASTKTSLTTTALNSLASATYVNAGSIDVSAIDPTELIIEVEATPGTVSGANPQLSVFVQTSFDNTNFSTGPVSGTTTTDEPVLTLIGTLPLRTSSVFQRKAFSVPAALAFVPPYLKVVIKNETGAALAASGHAVNWITYTGLST